jgi:pantoate--beta-alanine ligase
MQIFTNKNPLISHIKSIKANNLSIGFVPTMGALHDGHLSLLDESKKNTDISVVSIFVNPTQFNNSEDLLKYPRRDNEDIELLKKAGCDILFLPTVDEVYGGVQNKKYALGYIDTILEAAFRPGHFQGVARVVDILFDIVKPHKAFFGEKDFQQLAVINRLVELENIPIEIIPCPIIREDDGLAMSSRNLRLTSEQRALAPEICKILLSAKKIVNSLGIIGTKKWVEQEFLNRSEFKLEYFEIVDRKTFKPLEEEKDLSNAIGLIAVYLGEIRLIDNINLSS